MSETRMQTNLACLFVAEAQIRIRNVTYWPLEEEGGKVAMVKSAACSLCTYMHMLIPTFANVIFEIWLKSKLAD